MLKYLISPFRFFVYIRECVFYEAHRFDRDNDRGPVIFPAFIVGVFDAMISILMVVMIENIFFPESRFMETYLSSGVINILRFLWVFFVFFVEVIYYKVIFDGNEIIRRFEGFSRKRLILAKAIAFTYASLAFLGVGLAGYFS